MKFTTRRQNLDVAGRSVGIRRTTGGVVEIWADGDEGFAAALGFAHAHDRQSQLALTRLAGQGRLCECLRDEKSLLDIDVWIRQMGFRQAIEASAAACSDLARRFGEAYAAGVNAYVEAHGSPPALRLSGYRFEPWRLEDTLLVMQLMSYVGLTQTQQDLEKLIIHAIHNGVPVDRLKEMFSPHLDALDDGLVELIRRTKVQQPLIPALGQFVPSLRASNNWAVAGKHTASGFPLQANDPHLECNRLPAVWYEAVAHVGDEYGIGITMPGVPGFMMGRSRHVSFGFTYGFMDMIDYFIEECRGGKYRRGDDWVPLEQRTEIIERRNNPPLQLTLYRTDVGELETDSAHGEPPDGYYLSRAYAGLGEAAARSLETLANRDARTAAEVQEIVRGTTLSANWLVADREGNIGYQQSGRLPLRRHSGLFPLPAWDRQNHWQGFAADDALASCLNPPEGYLVTANDDHNRPGGPLSINACMGPYRAERIRELLANREKLTVQDMQAIQLDLVSTQARRFMALLEPWLPGTPAAELLKTWDLRYDVDSLAATLFERFYDGALREVFGRGLLGLDAWDAISGSTGILAAFYYFFDCMLLEGGEAWFGGGGREALFRRVLREVCDVPPGDVPRWGDVRQLHMKNMLLGETLPAWLSRLIGSDVSPFELPGGRATVPQSAMFTSHGRTSSFAPSYRFIADLARDDAHTALAGGPSDRIFSTWYAADLERWRGGQYKTLSADGDDPRDGRPTGDGARRGAG